MRLRPSKPRDLLPPATDNHVPPRQARGGRREVRIQFGGTAGEPSGMTDEHARPLLHRREVPQIVSMVLRRSRMIALQKPGRGAKGIVASDVVQRFGCEGDPLAVRKSSRRCPSLIPIRTVKPSQCRMHRSSSRTGLIHIHQKCVNDTPRTASHGAKIARHLRLANQAPSSKRVDAECPRRPGY